MKTTHTPGPWEVRSFPAVVGIVRTINESTLGAELARLDSVPNAEANARLMKAAPDMLEALERLAAMAQVHNDKTGYFNDLNPYQVLNIIAAALAAMAEG